MLDTATDSANLYDDANLCRHCRIHVGDDHRPDCVYTLGLTHDGRTPLFWCEHTGETRCYTHLGGYDQAAVTANPRAHRWPTPLNHWLRVLEEDHTQWLAEFGCRMTCNTCHPR